MTEKASGRPDPAVKKAKLLNFKAVGRPLKLDALVDEFKLMSEALKKEQKESGTLKKGRKKKASDDKLKAEIVTRICEKSGTHLIKLVSPRADGVLRVTPRGENAGRPLLPSVNAPDIPFAKIIFRPLEIADPPHKSVVDHVLCPDDTSEKVFSAFREVFGEDVLEAMKTGLLSPPPAVEKLSDAEFPIIFIRSPTGGDLQITPVSPALAYMDMKAVAERYLMSRRRRQEQTVSNHLQNISGAIEGPRVRFLAEMPSGLAQYDAELYRYVQGGGFPRWREHGVDAEVLHYAELVDRDREFNNQNTRRGLDGLADKLIADARAFIRETCEDARRMAEHLGLSVDSLAPPPRAAEVLLNPFWPEGVFDRARRVLNGAHFEYRENQNLSGT